MGECQAPVHRKPKSLPGGTPAAAYRCWRVQNDETVINYPPVGGADCPDSFPMIVYIQDNR